MLKNTFSYANSIVFWYVIVSRKCLDTATIKMVLYVVRLGTACPNRASQPPDTTAAVSPSSAMGPLHCAAMHAWAQKALTPSETFWYFTFAWACVNGLVSGIFSGYPDFEPSKRFPAYFLFNQFLDSRLVSFHCINLFLVNIKILLFAWHFDQLY